MSTAVTISLAEAVGYSFPGASGTAVWAAPAAYGSPHNEPATASALSPANQAATRLAMQAWANLANLSLVEIGETETDVGDIRLAHTADPAIASYWGVVAVSERLLARWRRHLDQCLSSHHGLVARYE
jgi:hypothetical protein